MEPVARSQQREARRAGWRIAFVVAVGFVVAELAAWPLAFIVPLLAVQFLAALPGPPGLRQALVVTVVFSVTTLVALLAAELLLERPGAYVLLLFAVYALAFHLDGMAKAKLIAALLLLANIAIPIVTLRDSTAGIGLRDTLVYGAILALLLALLAHALFPARRASAPPPPVAAPPGGRSPLVSSAILLLPVVVSLSQPGDVALPLVITVMSLLRQTEAGMSTRLALGLLLGNLIGGLAATLAYLVLSLFPFLASLCLVMLAAGLWFGGRIVVAGPRAPVYVVALITFIILLGSGLITITDGSGAAFVSRLGGVLGGTLYVLGALVLVQGWRRPATAG